MPAKSKSNEIRITRVYDAPVKAVWDAWTDPAQVGKWWGPRGFTLTTHSKDLRPGGTWVYTMHGPDGTDYPNITVYHEVEKYAKLVYDHGANDKEPPKFRVSVTFAEEGGKTTMDMRMILKTPEEAEQTRVFIKKAGGNSTWDRLAEYLGERATGKEKFVIARSFDVGVETLFEMWTNPEHFARWLPPVGFTMKMLRSNFARGGESFYVMEGKEFSMWGKINYLEINRPTRLVYAQSFADKDGNLSRHPKIPVWPPSMRTTVLFASEGADQSRMTVTWEPDPAATAEEIQAFVNLKAGMSQGWTGSMDKLEAYIEQQGLQLA